MQKLVCPIVINILKIISETSRTWFNSPYFLRCDSISPMHCHATIYCQYLLWIKYLRNFRLLPSFEIMLTIPVWIYFTAGS